MYYKCGCNEKYATYNSDKLLPACPDHGEKLQNPEIEELAEKIIEKLSEQTFVKFTCGCQTLTTSNNLCSIHGYPPIPGDLTQELIDVLNNLRKELCEYNLPAALTSSNPELRKLAQGLDNE